MIVEDKNPLWLAAQLNFDVFFWGEEWRSDENQSIEIQLKAQGIQVIWLARNTRISSSKLRDII